MWAFGVVAALSILTADEGVGVDARRYRQHLFVLTIANTL